MIAPERKEALRSLVEYERKRPRLLFSGVRPSAPARHLAEGVVRWRATLDFLISSASEKNRPESHRGDFPKIRSVWLRNLLRLAVYEMRIQNPPTPAHAAVDQAVALAKEEGSRREAGFVNALLRRMSERPPPWPDRKKPLEYICAAKSFPAWMARRWIARFGPDGAEALCDELNRSAPLAAACRADREEIRAALEKEGIRSRPSRISSVGLLLEGRPVLEKCRAFQEGKFWIQDEASQAAAFLAGPPAGAGRCLDVCAAPGGKAMFLASLGWEVTGWDISPQRLERLKENAAKTGLPLRAECRDFLSVAAEPAWDLVFLDAPCSATGTIRRRPDVKWNKTEKSLASCAVRQKEMIRRAALFVKPGGLLIYSTCSLEPEENEGIVEGFLKENAGFVVDRAAPEDLRPLLNSTGYLRLLPHVHGTDGGFAVRLRRK